MTTEFINDGIIGPYKIVLTNNSKVQSYFVGMEGKTMQGLPPRSTIEFEGSDDLKFEVSTARLITQGEINYHIKVLEEVKPESKKIIPQNACSVCEGYISPRNKNGICQKCRKNS
ncbi:MAG: hypothetical protein V3W20_08580 [Candidatus Neomarinimicrobiota bacterium]